MPSTLVAVLPERTRLWNHQYLPDLRHRDTFKMIVAEVGADDFERTDYGVCALRCAVSGSRYRAVRITTVTADRVAVVALLGAIDDVIAAEVRHRELLVHWTRNPIGCEGDLIPTQPTRPATVFLSPHRTRGVVNLGPASPWCGHWPLAVYGRRVGKGRQGQVGQGRISARYGDSPVNPDYPLVSQFDSIAGKPAVQRRDAEETEPRRGDRRGADRAGAVQGFGIGRAPARPDPRLSSVYLCASAPLR
jgi:hypothetical protein